MFMDGMKALMEGLVPKPVDKDPLGLGYFKHELPTNDDEIYTTLSKPALPPPNIPNRVVSTPISPWSKQPLNTQRIGLVSLDGDRFERTTPQLSQPSEGGNVTMVLPEAPAPDAGKLRSAFRYPTTEAKGPLFSGMESPFPATSFKTNPFQPPKHRATPTAFNTVPRFSYVYPGVSAF